MLLRAVADHRHRDPLGHRHRLLQLARRRSAARRCSSATRRASCAVACSRRCTSCATSSSSRAWRAPASPTSSTSACMLDVLVADPHRDGHRLPPSRRASAARRRNGGAACRPCARSRSATTATARLATVSDFDRLVGPAGDVQPAQRHAARRVHQRRPGPRRARGRARGEQGRRGDLRLLHPRRRGRGRDPRGRGRLPGAVDDGRRRLLRRDRRPHRQRPHRGRRGHAADDADGGARPRRCAPSWRSPRSTRW